MKRLGYFLLGFILGSLLGFLLYLSSANLVNNQCLECSGWIGLSCQVSEVGWCPFIGNLHLFLWILFLIPGIPFEVLFAADSWWWSIVGYGIIGSIFSILLLFFKKKFRSQQQV